MNTDNPSNGSAEDSLELTVLMPVRNEGANLPMMLRMLSAFLDSTYEVLVVYDDLSDDTIPVIEREKANNPGLRGLLNDKGHGVGSALSAGVEAALGKYVFFLGADDIGPVMAMSDMLALMDEGCDFVSSTRYAHGAKRLSGPWHGRLLSRMANRLLPIVAGSVFSDSTDATKMFRRSVFSEMDLQSSDVGCVIGLEMAIKAQVMGLELGEVPVLSIDRPFGGQSKFKLLPWMIEYGKWFCLAMFKYGKKMRDYKGSIRVKSSVFE